MNIQTFRGRDIKHVMAAVEEALGLDAVIVRTSVVRGSFQQVEVVAAAAIDIERLRRRLDPPPLRAPTGEKAGRPLVLALVGPTGSGKTTTLAKLAVNPAAFGGWKVGLLTLDTFRTGALEQLESYARVTGLPLEIVYSSEELPAAMERLASCDVILVDTPGRSPKNTAHNAAWMSLLNEIRADEVHLVIPAPIRLDVASAALDAYDAVGITNLLITKLDEVPGDAGVADLAIEMRLKSRWVTDGQEIPMDLHIALPRLLGSLGSYSGGLEPVRISA